MNHAKLVFFTCKASYKILHACMFSRSHFMLYPLEIAVVREPLHGKVNGTGRKKRYGKQERKWNLHDDEVLLFLSVCWKYEEQYLLNSWLKLILFSSSSTYNFFYENHEKWEKF